jgi:hypothetical protein
VYKVLKLDVRLEVLALLLSETRRPFEDFDHEKVVALKMKFCEKRHPESITSQIDIDGEQQPENRFLGSEALVFHCFNLVPLRIYGIINVGNSMILCRTEGESQPTESCGNRREGCSEIWTLTGTQKRTFHRTGSTKLLPLSYQELRSP